ncbi:MAG: hypothetical protein ACP5NY_04940 [Thermocladium sp.]
MILKEPLIEVLDYGNAIVIQIMLLHFYVNFMIRNDKPHSF